jgi:rhamnulokinase
MLSLAAVDLGAQSGRVAVGRFGGSTLDFEVVHRFPNGPVHEDGRLRWDARALFAGVCNGLEAAGRYTDIASVGVDSWAVDFGLIDRDGELLGNPVSYRDSRRARGYQEALSRIGAEELYLRTAIQLMPINTVFELGAMAADREPALAQADRLLLLPDLFNYWLCGSETTEFTNATTTQCLDVSTGDWALDLTDRLGIPANVFPEIVASATLLGTVADDVDGVRGASVVAGATHDTAAAVVGTPLTSRNSVFLSVGTWSLVGFESETPVVGARAYEANLTNEGGVEGTYRVLRNVAGLWLLDECRRAWAGSGGGHGINELLAAAEAAPAFRSFIDPNDPVFVEPGDMPARIATYCEETGQDSPADEGAFVRCILESLSLKHAETIDVLADAAERRLDELHVVGGGANNHLLCRWTAAAAERPVYAGPSEATLVGNLLTQAIALGELGSLEEARTVARQSFAPTVYEPVLSSEWREARECFAALARASSEALR